MTALQAEYGDDLVVMGTDGGAFPDGSAAGWGVTIGKLTAPFQRFSTDCYTETHSLHGAVEESPTEPTFMGAKRQTNHTGELSGMIQAMLYLLTMSNSISVAALMYDAENDAGAIIRDRPGKTNTAMVSTGQMLRRAVEAAGITLIWVKVKGHSGDVINDKADAWATDGRDGTSTPRELELGEVLAQHG
jgi:ribonuclease HI